MLLQLALQLRDWLRDRFRPFSVHFQSPPRDSFNLAIGPVLRHAGLPEGHRRLGRVSRLLSRAPAARGRVWEPHHATCLSSSHVAYGAIRLEWTFFLLGQAAATAAAQALATKSSLQNLPYAPLSTRLEADGEVLGMNPVPQPKAQAASITRVSGQELVDTSGCSHAQRIEDVVLQVASPSLATHSLNDHARNRIGQI